MEGFQDGVPFQAAVTWLPRDTSGNVREATLLDWKPSRDGSGIVAAVATSTGQDRYFVPWTSLYYLRQSVPAQPPVEVAVIPVKPQVGPPPDGGPPRGR